MCASMRLTSRFTFFRFAFLKVAQRTREETNTFHERISRHERMNSERIRARVKSSIDSLRWSSNRRHSSTIRAATVISLSNDKTGLDASSIYHSKLIRNYRIWIYRRKERRLSEVSNRYIIRKLVTRDSKVGAEIRTLLLSFPLSFVPHPFLPLSSLLSRG